MSTHRFLSYIQDVAEGKSFSFPKEERQVLAFWEEIDAFQQQLKRTEGQPEYIFYDGPPFATGLPHYGHILAGTIKDIVTRYASMTGHHVERRFGWDTHGLPVEYEIDKKLNIKNRDDVLKMGIGTYNEECRSIVMRYASEWERTVTRLGRWIDFKNDYKTLYPSYMESVWWVFKTLHEKGLVYRGYKVMPYSVACSTPLSNFEAGLNYKDVPDPAIMVTFPIKGDPDRAELLAWTTTPWTLPSNLCLCVNADFDYVRARDPGTNKVIVAAQCRLESIPGAVPKKAKKGGKGKESGGGGDKGGWEVLSTCKGADLVGLEYEPLFPYYAHRVGKSFRVVADGYVTADAGTGVVHCAPAFGEDDNRVCYEQKIVDKGEELPCPVDADGRFEDPVLEYAGQFVKDADKALVAAIKEKGRLYDNQTFVHSYPYCWRSDTPLIYKAVPSWFVSVEKIKERLLVANDQTSWVPAYVKEKRFQNWLEGAHDWAVSRSRFWGTPIPIWMSDDGQEVEVIGSIAELEARTGQKVEDIHRHKIDHLEIPSKQGKGTLKRVEDVFDCWFESGSMPYAQQHYPFENKERFEANFPADFIAEGLDQTRGWFYTLMVLSTALFDKPAFKNLICNGLVLAADGKKMSKRLSNYPDPNEVIEKYGADALRLYLINSPVVRAEPLRFKEEGVYAVVKDVFLPWYNAYRFFVQNALRVGMETGKPFDPRTCDVSKSTNVMDRWLDASTRTLTSYIRKEMEGYRLYTVVPGLVSYVESLTNIYVRFNRKRLKGAQDSVMGLTALYHALLTVSNLMAPFTPFFTETMYQNLRQLDPGLPESIHYVPLPEARDPTPEDTRIVKSVERMCGVIEQVRLIRDRQNRGLRTPLKSVTVYSEDADFLGDVSTKLGAYIQEESNAIDLQWSGDLSKYCKTFLQPDFGALGPRLGKAGGKIFAALKNASPQDVALMAKQGFLDIGGERIDACEVKEGKTLLPTDQKEMDMGMDADGTLVVADLVLDASLVLSGVARELVNRFQKLRKSSGLVVSDPAEAFIHPANDAARRVLHTVLTQHGETLRATLGKLPGFSDTQPAWAVRIGREETSVGAGTEFEAHFEAILVTPCVRVIRDAFASGEEADGAAVYLQARNVGKLAEEVRVGRGVVEVQVDGKRLRLEEGKHFTLP